MHDIKGEEKIPKDHGRRKYTENQSLQKHQSIPNPPNQKWTRQQNHSITKDKSDAPSHRPSFYQKAGSILQRTPGNADSETRKQLPWQAL